MQNKKLSTFLLIVIFFISANGQEGRSLPFLSLNSEARSTSMGGTTFGESKGMYIYTNPTSFLYEDESVYGSYVYGLFSKEGDVGKRLNYHAVSLGYKMGKHALMAGFRYLGGLSVLHVDNLGIEGKTIKPMDWSIDLTYTRMFGDCCSAFLGGSFFYSYIGKAAHTVAINGGVSYRNKLHAFEKNWDYCITVGLYDLGGKVKYDNPSLSYDLPTSVGLGGSLSVPFSEDHKVNVAFSTRHFLLPSNASGLVTGLGGEYELFDTVALRAGYHFGDSNNYATFGAGVVIKHVRIDASYLTSGSETIGNRWLFGIGFKF